MSDLTFDGVEQRRQDQEGKVAVIVLNWNGAEDTVACLESLTRLHYSAVETVIVDNGSTDGSVRTIRERFPAVPIIETGANLGYAGGNNVGLRWAIECGFPFAMLLNNDTVVDPDLVGAFVRAAERFPEAGVFGAKIFYFAEPERLWYAGAEFDAESVRFRHVKEADSAEDSEGVQDTAYASGCALFVRAAVLHRIGLLEERFFLNYEETDFCFRARRAGFRVVYVPAAKLWHKVSVSSGGAGSPLQTYFLTRNRLLWAERNMPALTVARISIEAIWEIVWRVVPGFRIGVTEGAGLPRRIAQGVATFFRELIARVRQPRTRAVFRGTLDYFLRRFGDCPDQIRRLPR